MQDVTGNGSDDSSDKDDEDSEAASCSTDESKDAAAEDTEEFLFRSDGGNNMTAPKKKGKKYVKTAEKLAQIKQEQVRVDSLLDIKQLGYENKNVPQTITYE